MGPHELTRGNSAQITVAERFYGPPTHAAGGCRAPSASLSDWFIRRTPIGNDWIPFASRRSWVSGGLFGALSRSRRWVSGLSSPFGSFSRPRRWVSGLSMSSRLT
jgi:hypothetical protein